MQTDQYLRLYSHHPLEHNLGVIKILQNRAKTQRPGKHKNMTSRRPRVNEVIPAGLLSNLGRHLKNAPANPGAKKDKNS